MKKPGVSPALEILVLLAALLCGVQCQSSQGGSGGGGGAANLTVVGAVFCDACSSSSFSKNSYFLPGVKVRLDCMIKVNSNSKEEIKITAEKVTNSYGAYQLDIPAIDGFECAAPGATAAESFCRAAVLDNPSELCNVPAVTTTAGHISFPRKDPSSCFYSLNSLYFRPSGKPPEPAAHCGGGGGVSPAAAVNTSLLLPAMAMAAHPVLHAKAVVPSHTVLHAAAAAAVVPSHPVLHAFSAAAGIPVLPAAADSVPHAAVASAAGVPFPAPAMAMDAAVSSASAAAVVSVSSPAADLCNSISAAAVAAAAVVPVCVTAASTATSLAALAVAVPTAAASSAAAAATSAAVISLAFSAITILPSRFFRAISSTCGEVFSERSNHLVSFRK